MAEAPNNVPPAVAARADDDKEEVVYAQFQPAAEASWVPVQMRATRRSVPYKVTSSGLGIFLTEGLAKHRVLARVNGNSFRFNKPNNLYGLKLTTLVMVDMQDQRDNFVARANHAPNEDGDDEDDNDNEEAQVVIRRNPGCNVINRVSKQGAFDTIYKGQAKLLAALMGFEVKLPNQRQLKAVWKVWTGFNKADARNHELGKIALIFVKIRAGVIPFYGDEFQAAVAAVKLYYVSVTPEYSSPPATLRKHELRILSNNTMGSWMLPVILAFNDHLIEVGLPPILFSVDARDHQQAIADRAQHSRAIWRSGKEIKVESRPQVLQKYAAYANDEHNFDLPPVPPCKGPPAIGEGAPAPRRARYSLGY